MTMKGLSAVTTAIGAAVDEVTRIVRKRSVLFVVSDFMDQGWERPLSIAARRHDVIPVVVGDRAEAEATIAEVVAWRREHQPGGQNFHCLASSHNR